MRNDIPLHLSHKPIVYSYYEERDWAAGAGDAKWLSIGQATWGQKCFSAKIFRKADTGRWSRQSEELPLWRVLDLAIFTVSAILDCPIRDIETAIVEGKKVQLDELKSEISECKDIYGPRLSALKKLLDTCDIPCEKNG